MSYRPLYKNNKGAMVDLPLDAETLQGHNGSYYTNYNNLSNKPTIPTNTNQLTNGSGFITSSALNNYVKKNSDVTIRQKIYFEDTNNPFIKMTSGANSYFLQAYQGQMSLGTLWATASKWDKNGNLSVVGDISEKGKKLSDKYMESGGMFVTTPQQGEISLWFLDYTIFTLNHSNLSCEFGNYDHVLTLNGVEDRPMYDTGGVPEKIALLSDIKSPTEIGASIGAKPTNNLAVGGIFFDKVLN